MKKAKKILLLMTILMTFSIFDGNVKAETFNGTSSNGFITGGKGSCAAVLKKQKKCLYNNKNHFTVQVTLYYIDGSTPSKIKFEPLKRFYWTSSENVAGGWADLTEAPKGVILQKTDGVNDYKTAAKTIRKYFTANNYKNSNDLFEKYNTDKYNQEAQPNGSIANGTSAKKGYRIVIEPMLSYQLKDNSIAFDTTKDILTYYNDFNSRQKKRLLYEFKAASGFYTVFDDVGIRSYSNTKCDNNISGYAKNINTGCGYLIVDPSPGINKCYSSSVKEISKLECINTDQNNIGKYSEIYEKKSSCEGATKEEENATEYGKLYKEVNGCKLYCIESASVSFPGNRSGDININKNDRGAYFAWPTKIEDGLYNMSMTSIFTCTLVKSGGSCSQNDIEQLKSTIETGYINNAKFESSLTAGTNNLINKQALEIYESKTNNKTTVSWADSLTSNPITFSKTVYFKINDNTNRVYDKKQDTVLSLDLPNDNIIFNRKEGVVSLSDKDDTNKTYDLILSDISLGTSNKFGKQVGTYTCHYNLNSSGDTPCVCPSGTLNEGESLACINSNNNKEPCSELIQIYCNLPKNEWPLTCKDTCVDSNGITIDLDACTTTQKKQQNISTLEAKNWCTQKFCSQCTDSKGKIWNLAECMAKGNSYASCKKQYCPSIGTCSGKCTWESDTDAYGSTMSILYCGEKKEPCNTNFHCPGGDNENMNPTACVQSKSGYANLNYALSQGWITKSQLKKYLEECEKVVCPYGKKIIYRVIDLDNPFPGKKVNGEYKIFSNNGVKSRKPGYNWLSEKVVSSKILKARGSNGYDLYKKEPLITITLTPNDIKSIRNYNKKNNYSNFDLNCLNNSKTADCTSNFLRKNMSNIVTKYISKCASITNPEQFDKCYNSND